MPALFAVVRRFYENAGRDEDETWINVIYDVRTDGRDFATLITLEPWSFGEGHQHWLDKGYYDFIVELTQNQYNQAQANGLYHDGNANLPMYQQQNTGSGATTSLGSWADPEDDLTAWNAITPIPDPRWILRIYEGNPDATSTAVGITAVGTTATVTHTSHGLSTNDEVVIAGANEADYNGTFRITVIDTDTYTYEMSGSPSSPATGSITSTPENAHVAAMDFDEDTGNHTMYLVIYSAADSRLNTNAVDQKTEIAGVGFIFDFGSSHSPPLGAGASSFRIETDRPGTALFASSRQYRLIGPSNEKRFTARIWGRSLPVRAG